VSEQVLLATIYNQYYEYCLKPWLDFAFSEKELYPGLSILITLDNASPDLVHDFKDLEKENEGLHVKDMGVIPNPDPTKPNFAAIVACRNEAFDVANRDGYGKLLFVDVDTNPESGAVRKLKQYFTSKRLSTDKIAMVGGNYHFKNQMLDHKGKGIVIPVGDFPVKSDKLFARQINRRGFTDRVRGLGFGFTMIDRVIFTNPKYRLDLDFLKPDSKFGTEDYPICERVRNDGYKLVWARNVRAKHLYFNKEANRVERW
jgi:hypothetical protein